VNIYARRGIPTSALPHLVGDRCAAFPTILIGNQIAEYERMNTMPLARMAEAQIIRFWALEGPAAFEPSGVQGSGR